MLSVTPASRQSSRPESPTLSLAHRIRWPMLIMNNKIDETSKLVNSDKKTTTDFVPRPTKIRVVPLPERIQWVMDKTGKYGRVFARHCDLPSETHVGLLMRPGRKTLREETARRIGKACNVSWVWLATGEGRREPYEGDADGPLTAESLHGWDAEEERYPTRAAVVAMLRRRSAPLTEIEEMAIEGLLSLRLASPEDPGERHWLTRFRDLQLLAQELVDEDAGRVVRDDSYERRVLDPSRDGEEIKDG